MYYENTNKIPLGFIFVLTVCSILLFQNSVSAHATSANVKSPSALYADGPAPILLKSQPIIKSLLKGEVALIIIAETQWNGPLIGIDSIKISKINLTTGKLGTPSEINKKQIIKLKPGIFEIKLGGSSGVHVLTIIGTYFNGGLPAKTEATNIVIDLFSNNSQL